MQERVRKYYRGERFSNVVFLSFGIFSCIVSCIYHLAFGTALSLGLMIALGGIGIYQFIHGIIRFWQSFGQFEKAIHSNTAKDNYLTRIEKPRLNRLDKLYAVTRNVESILFLISFTIMVICALAKSPGFLLGAAAGITFHSAVMLVFDLLSQFRVREYLFQINKL